MSAPVLRRSAVRHSLCGPQCLLSRRTRAYYSQSPLSSIAGRIQDPEASTSGSPGERRTATWSGSYHAVTGAKNPLNSTRLDRYLASITTADSEPTLDDVEQCKPERFSRPDSSRYAAEYTNLLDALCRSFSKDQLRRFTELYKLDPIWTRSSRRKTEYAESIIEKAWGWPSLKEIERKRRDTTELLVKSFTITPSQLFLLLGKDGADLLQLSMQYNVHVSLTSNPLALRVEGLRGSLKGLTEYVSSVKKGIIDEIFELPSGRPVRPDLLQRISRLSGAYVENHGNRGKVRVCAKELGDIAAAKRLALRASLDVGTRERTVCYDPLTKISDSPIEVSEPQRYAIYPFVTPRSLPWTMHSGGAFRLRRVADWLGVNSYENITSTGGLADNPHRLLNLNKSGAELSQLIHSIMPENASYHRRTITALLGHILISSGENSQRDTMFPPLRGTLSLPDILEWVDTSRTPLTFVPSIPSAAMTTADDERREIHRLIYRTLPQTAGQVSRLPQHVLKFEMELSCSPPISIEAAGHLQNDPELEDEISSDDSNSGAEPHLSQGNTSHPGNLSEALDGWDPTCRVGREAYVNFLLPDRPMDMQLCIFDWDDVTLMRQPQVLQEYSAKLRPYLTNKPRRSQPDPPPTFRYDGREFYLHDSLNLRQSRNPNVSSSLSDGYVDDLVEVSSESTVDLQSDQKMEHSQVKFNGTTEGPSWKRFLATCDHLSMLPLESRSTGKL